MFTFIKTTIFLFIHRKSGFAKVSKNLARYKSKNNLVKSIKQSNAAKYNQ